MLLNDAQIRTMAKDDEMITPFSERTDSQTLGRKIISYGLSSYGYDMRIGNDFLVFTNAMNAEVDPKNFSPENFIRMSKEDGEPCIIPPNSFVLGQTVEYFKIPRNMLTICVGKSTYARCGIIVNITPFEPEWEGTATLEISNTTPNPARIYAGEGISQIIFFWSPQECEVSYADRAGLYQKQKEITLPRT